MVAPSQARHIITQRETGVDVEQVLKMIGGVCKVD